MKKVKLRLSSSSYDIEIGAGILGQSGTKLTECGFKDSAVIVTNPVVDNLYGDTIRLSLITKGFRVNTLIVPDGERQKSLETAGRLYQQLADCCAERNTPIIALGGGVIGDLAGFVAATYLRGVPLIQVPTTLLAQVDSSIGGKVAVDHNQLKNRVGSFYQPKMVISDIDTIDSLGRRQITDGLSEVIKYGLIQNPDFFTYLENNLEKVKLLDKTTLEEVVFQSARIKGKVVEEDEKDFGLRTILNFGHTVGHAVETVSDFNVSHGEAVAIGMLAAARISQRMDIFRQNELSRLENLIKRAGLPTGMADPKLEEIILVMMQDKKVQGGKIRFVLPESIGKVFLTDDVDLHMVKEALKV